MPNPPAFNSSGEGGKLKHTPNLVWSPDPDTSFSFRFISHVLDLFSSFYLLIPQVSFASNELRHCCDDSAMNGTPPPAIIASKAVNTSKTPASSGQSSPALSQANPITSGNQGGGTFRAAGTSSSRASPTPRNNQSQRNKHKGSKRFARLTDEDVIAESVCFATPSLTLCL